MPAYAYATLAAGWLIWMTPFFLAKRHTEPAKELDRRARWGVVLVGIAYALLWQGKFWERSMSLGGWRFPSLSCSWPLFFPGRARAHSDASGGSMLDSALTMSW